MSESALANLLMAGDAARGSCLRWPHDEMCRARWDGFREAAAIALAVTPSAFEDLVVREAGR